MNESCDRAGPAPSNERRAWVRPELRTMHAGSAEAGPNPNVPEGPFAKGS